jgi:hypothetical protein
MLGLLEDIFDVVTNLPDYVLYALETLANLFFALFQVTVLAAIAFLPSLPEITSPPTIVGWLNWSYPLVEVLAFASPLVTCYVTFLGLRWIFKKAGVL